jgi:ornithine cyclodeaminase/alanine dehydrogenase-like protein (mu-crystallin family)
MIVIGRETVARQLTFPVCIPLMREAMIALSQGRTRQLLRGILDLGGGNMLGVMPGSMDDGPFGAKLVSVYPANFAKGGPSHQGVIALFDPDDGAPICLVDAGEVTAIRTAAASAAATDVLARTDASRLAILGYGEQAWRHAGAVAEVRKLSRITVWGRSPNVAESFAARVQGELGLRCVAAPSVEAAVGDADIICTTTAAADPILFSRQVADGAHLNLVGSGRAGPSEVDTALVVRSRFFADHREGVLAQGAEFLNAKAEGLVDEAHVLGEIGEVMAGTLPGRLSDSDVTVYKSLGSIVQDLACGWSLYRQALAGGADFGAQSVEL